MLSAALLVLGVALAGPIAWRGGGAGMVALALGLAADRMTGSTPAPPTVLAANAGLQLLGILAAGGAIHRSLRGRVDPLALAGGVAAAIGALLLLLRAGPALTVVPAAALAAVAIPGGLWLLLTGVLRRFPADRQPFAPPLPWAPTAPALVLFGTGALAAALAPHVGVVLIGASAAAWGAWWAVPRTERPWPIAAALATALLAVALRLFSDIAGPVGLAAADIPALPLSPAAELLLAPLLLAAAWALTGLWPLRQPSQGVWTAPVAALLLVRVAIPALPAGIDHWRPAVYPVLVLGMWYAAMAGRLAPLPVAGALLGLASLDPAGRGGAGWLLTVAVAGMVLRGRRDRITTAALALAGAAGGMLVLESGLRTEVVYTVLAALALSVALDRAPALTPPHPRSIFPRDEVSHS